MRRALTLALAIVLPGLAPAAFAQYDEVALPVITPSPLNPEGRPSGSLAATPLSYAVWHDEAGWQVRMTAGSGSTRFSGSIGAPFGVTHPRTMSANLPLDVTATGISFDFLLDSGQTGFDFQAPQGSCLDFRLSIDGKDRPTRVFVGKEQALPGPGGFQLCGPGHMDAQAVKGPELDPAAFTALLAPYGTWSEVEGYGSLWQPQSQIVGPGFIPYTDGKWVYTNAGWVFVSSYEWGWAPFHYGNWVYLDSGWYWRPGPTWGPAWVEWRYGTGYFGWAPLPPIDAKVVAVNPAPFVFVPTDKFTAPSIRPYVISGERAEAIAPQTSALVSAAVVEGQPVVPVNAGPSPELVVVSGVPVQPVPVTTLVTVVPPPTVVVTTAIVVSPMPYYRPYPYPYYGRPPPYYGAPGYRPPYYGAPGYRPPAYYPPPGRPIPGTPTAPPPGGRPPGGGTGQPPRVTPVPPGGGGSGGSGGDRVRPAQPSAGGGGSPSTRPAGGASPATRPSGGASPSTRPSGGASPSTRPSGGGSRGGSGSRGGRGGGGRR